MQLTALEPPAAALCCAPLSQAPMTGSQAEEVASRFKALSDPARLRLLSLIMASPEQTACTCDLTEPLGLSQPTVTHHLRKLVAAGLVETAGRAGTFTYYRAVPASLEGLAGLLASATTAPPEA